MQGFNVIKDTVLHDIPEKKRAQKISFEARGIVGRKSNGRWTDTLMGMKHGESVFIPEGPDMKSSVCCFRIVAKRKGKRIEVRRVDGGYRVWLVEPDTV